MGTLAVDNIQHTDGSSAVTLNNATITTGSIPAASVTGTLGSGVTFPAGHTIKTHNMSYRFTTGSHAYSVSTTFATVTHSSPGGAMEITGITATEGNLLHMSAYGGSSKSINDATYESVLGFIIDGEEHSQQAVYQNTPYSFWNGHVGMVYTVPAGFTNKTISLAARTEGGSGTFTISVRASRAPQTLWMLVSEIQQ
jgi:hypothetical protein